MPAKKKLKKSGAPSRKGGSHFKAREEEVAEIEACAKLIDRTLTAPSVGFWEQVKALVDRSAKSIPKSLLDEGETRGVAAWELFRAFERNDKKKLLELYAILDLGDDASCEKAAPLTLWEVTEWQEAHPGQAARPGVIWRWLAKREEMADAARNERVLREHAAEIVSHDRDLTPPCPGDDASFCEAFEIFRQWDWRDPDGWPLMARVKNLLGMPRVQIMKAASSGRWGARDVVRGTTKPGEKIKAGRPPELRGSRCDCQATKAVEKIKIKAGRPQARLSPRALAKVLRAFAKSHPHMSAEAETLARYLSGVLKR